MFLRPLGEGKGCVCAGVWVIFAPALAGGWKDVGTEMGQARFGLDEGHGEIESEQGVWMPGCD